MNTEQKVAVSATAEDKPTVLLGNAGYSMSSGTQLQSTGKVLFEPQTFIPQGIRQEETRIKTQDVESIDLNDPKNKGFTLEEIKMIQKYAIPAEKENLEGWAVADDKDKKSAVAELALARDDDFLEITFVFKDHADGEMVQNLINTYHISKINNF